MIAAERTKVIGIVNVTPDSFSDGGRYIDSCAAIAHGCDLIARGADIVDIGGESTRPGAQRIDEQTECARVIPVISALVREGISVSVDTMHAGVAREALVAGACIINDVSAGLADKNMFSTLKDSAADLILTHWQSGNNYRSHEFDYTSHENIVKKVRDELLLRVDSAVSAGISLDRLIIDPGLGFAKTAEDNWRLLRALPDFQVLGCRLLVGASRKNFLGRLLSDETGDVRPFEQRDCATAVISGLASQLGIWGVRVHDPMASLDAIKVFRMFAGVD